MGHRLQLSLNDVILLLSQQCCCWLAGYTSGLYILTTSFSNTAVHTALVFWH